MNLYDPQSVSLLEQVKKRSQILGYNGANIKVIGNVVISSDVGTSAGTSFDMAMNVVSYPSAGAYSTTVNGQTMDDEPSYAAEGKELFTQSYVNSDNVENYSTLIIEGTLPSTTISDLSVIGFVLEVQDSDFPSSSLSIQLSIPGDGTCLLYQTPTNPSSALTYTRITNVLINSLQRIGVTGGTLFQVVLTPDTAVTLTSGYVLVLLLKACVVRVPPGGLPYK